MVTDILFFDRFVYMYQKVIITLNDITKNILIVNLLVKNKQTKQNTKLDVINFEIKI